MRRLTLKREPLAALSADELSAVAAGSHLCGTTHGPSIDESCDTLPVTYCWERFYDVLFTGACGR